MTEPIRCFAVPGNGGSAARWQRLEPHLPDDVELRPVTLPGFGGRPLPTERPTIERFAEWLRADVEGAGPTDGGVIVLGHGIGGSIVLQAAQTAALGDGYLLHAPVGPFLADRLFPRLMRPPIVRETARRLISGPVGRLLLRRRFDPAMAADFAQGYADCAAFSVMFDLLDQGWFDALQPIDTPAVVLWGADDRVLSEKHRHGFAHVLPEADVEVVPGWGHYPMIENAADYARVLAEHCRALVGRPEPGS